jgi:SWIM zinc finger
MATTREQRAADEAFLYSVRIEVRTATRVKATVTRIGCAGRSYRVNLSLDGIIACQCEDSKRNPGPCKHAYRVLAELEANA